MNRDLLLMELTTEEGFSAPPYDDKQPNVPLTPGIVIKGTITFGHGLTFLTDSESRLIIAGRLSAMESELSAVFPWFDGLSDARQRALIDMAYNLGVAGLKGFTTFLGFVQAGKFNAAADDLKTTLWAGQVGSRAVKIETQIRNG